MDSNSKTKIEDFKFLYSMDWLAQLVIFDKLFESNQTLLSKDNLFPHGLFYNFANLQKLLMSESICFNDPNRTIQPNFRTINSSSFT
jgi:hypothetical protein